MAVPTNMEDEGASPSLLHRSPGKRKREEGGGNTDKGGMLWGAKSLSRRSTRFANKDHDPQGFGDFGKYMAEKQRKLRLQFQADAGISDSVGLNSNMPERSPDIGSNRAMVVVDCKLGKLFEGISIFVDGFTIPSHQELRSLMIRHGGSFENYFRRDHVTHIICSTLPDSKIKDSRSFSRGLPIVKPSWVVDSIACGKLLPIASYYLERLACDDPNQHTISTYLASKKNTVSGQLHQSDAMALQVGDKILQQIPQLGNVLNVDGTVDENYEEELSNSTEERGTNSHQIVTELKNDMPAVPVPDRCPSHQPCSAVLPTSREDINSTTRSEPLSTLVGHPNSNVYVDASKGNGVSSDGNARSHCTLGDANFVQNFFKNSRLHFIGTWRTRYQSRFGCMSADKNQSHDQLSSVPSSVESSARTIMHVDMDCFFVSVVVRNQPALADKPVAVCHSGKATGTAEISSSNYAARAFGVKSGMFIRDAKALCPRLEIVPYDFEGYHQVSDQFYDILHKHCKKVQAVSCDEAYLDVTGIADATILASKIRKEIFTQTRCTASVGIGGNLLLARMATRKAKPDGQYEIDVGQVEKFLSDLSVEDLPGVGWSLREKLHSLSIYNCAQLCALSKEALQLEFGTRTGDMLWSFARGIDNRQVEYFHERKSIGAEVNWGVRFKSHNDAQYFLSTLCKEVSERLQNADVYGRTFTLKIKKRKEGAGEPEKFMGCGSCDNLSKSVTLPLGTNNIDIIFRVSKQMLASFHLDVCEIRGMGLQVTKLETASFTLDAGVPQQKALESWLRFSSKGSVLEDSSKVKDLGHSMNERVAIETSCDMRNGPTASWGLSRSQERKGKGMQSLGKVLKGPFSVRKQQISSKGQGKLKAKGVQRLPDVSELDPSVLASLPPEIMAEINDAYDGAVVQYISMSLNLEDSSDAKICNSGNSIVKFERSPTEASICAGGQHRKITMLEAQTVLSRGAIIKCSTSNPEAGTCSRTSHGAVDSSEVLPMPLSLSQVDMAILEELPSQIREELIKSLPKHRVDSKHNTENFATSNNAGNLATSTGRLVEPSERPGTSGRQLHCTENFQKLSTNDFDGLWVGSPCRWVLLFLQQQGKGADFLHVLAKCYGQCGTPQNLSGVLLNFTSQQHLFSEWQDLLHDCIDSAVFQCCVELIRQYIQLKISSNLEEVFMVLRILKRLADKCKFWSQISNATIPVAQALSGEHYGGSLSLG